MTNQAYNMKRRKEQLAAYAGAIKASNSVPELAAALGIKTGAARRYVRLRWDDLPADARLEWLASAIAPVSAKVSGQAGGKKSRYKMIARSKPKTGAAQQIAVLNAKPPKEKITLSKMPFSLDIDEKYGWEKPKLNKLCQPTP